MPRRVGRWRDWNRLLVRGLRSHREGLLWLDGAGEVPEGEIERVRRDGPLVGGGGMFRHDGRGAVESTEQPKRAAAG